MKISSLFTALRADPTKKAVAPALSGPDLKKPRKTLRVFRGFFRIARNTSAGAGVACVPRKKCIKIVQILSKICANFARFARALLATWLRGPLFAHAREKAVKKCYHFLKRFYAFKRKLAWGSQVAAFGGSKMTQKNE